MSRLRIVRVRPRVSLSRVGYGIKARGYQRLAHHIASAPRDLRISVPPALAVPTRLSGGFNRVDLSQAFDGLTQGLTTRRVLLARSSALDEEPGQNETLFSLYDPTDIPGSRRRFLALIERLLDSSPQMAVLLNVMLGGLSILEDGREVIGADNVSFVADSHSPLDSDHMHFSLAEGLATTVVEGTEDTIPLIADRKTGDIIYFGNQNEASVFRVGASEFHAVDSISYYRQQYRAVYDVATGQIVRVSVDEDLDNRAILKVSGRGQLCDFLDLSVAQGPFVRGVGGLLGIAPFNLPIAYSSLINGLQYLFGAFDSRIQIEGGAAYRDAKGLSIFQVLEVPEVKVSGIPMTIQRPHMQSDDVIGSGRFELPLVVLERLDLYAELKGVLSRLDQRFADSGYILYAGAQTRQIMSYTSNCRVRLSGTHENTSSHPVTYIRLKLSKDPNSGYMLGMNVGKIRRYPYADEDYRHEIRVFNTAILASDGKRLALEIPARPKTLGNIWRSVNRFFGVSK